jgi:hypothetical protein
MQSSVVVILIGTVVAATVSRSICTVTVWLSARTCRTKLAARRLRVVPRVSSAAETERAYRSHSSKYCTVRTV